MLDDTDKQVPAAVSLDLDRPYANYLRSCTMSGVEPVPRERALGLIEEWGEVLSGRPEPTTH